MKAKSKFFLVKQGLKEEKSKCKPNFYLKKSLIQKM